jgi:hypothetical protein
MSDHRLDRVIDEVARQMTEGQPPADLRARIVARLDAGDRPRRFLPAVWALSPVAVAAAIVLAIFVARPFENRDLAPARADQTVRVPPSLQGSFGKTATPSPPGGFGATGRPDTAYDSGSTSPRTVKHPVERSTYGPSRAASEIDALAPPRLDVAPLSVEVLPTASIAVPRLDAIAPIAVEPLPANDQRP